MVSRLLQVRCQKMNRTKYLKGECRHCGGHLEFPADHIGTVVPCPHCQQETELLLLPPPEEPTLPRRVLVWTGIAVVILGLGFWGALIALKRAQRWAARQKEQTAVAPAVQIPTTPIETNSPAPEELSASELTLEKTPGSSLIYAVGTVTNRSTRERFGVKVEVELLDDAGQKIGVASDYRQVLPAGAPWQFKALVVDSKAKSAKLSWIKEDQQ
jgi:hypothetical protein